MSEFSSIEKPKGKVFNESQIIGGTFLGGPLVAGYLMAENFKTFGQHEKVLPTWITTIVFTVGLFCMLLLIPDLGELVQRIIPFLYTIIVALLVTNLQRANIKLHLGAGGERESWWHAIAAVVSGMLVTIIAVVTLTFIADPSIVEPAEAKHYGQLQHEIAFKRINISEEEVDVVAKALTNTAFFDDYDRKFVYVSKSGNTLEIAVAMNEDAVHRHEVISYFEDVHRDLEMLLQRNTVVITLVVGSYDNVFRKIE